ncbi:MAG: hypothetical protein EZS28_000189 [Streblomastix strix]|uniref:DDE-1 domain-containing protein n=1 Tax=Streblomastix strix TaxID=222440 RepID=A0A5J4XAX8_9EUKA|nr:MAG: hypothetical protein EZS28_000189 [Streblomastix strix]
MKIVLERVFNIIDTKGSIYPFEIRQETAKFRKDRASKSFHLFFIGRHNTEIEFGTPTAKEEARLKVKQVDLEKYGELIRVHVIGVFSDLCYCLDEAGYSGYCDTHKRRLIIRAKDKNRKLNIPVDSPEKKFSIAETIVLNGEALNPYIIQKKPVDFHAYKVAGNGDGLNCYISKSEGTNMNIELMEHFLSSIFVQHVTATRIRLGMPPNERAILLMDNLMAHITPIHLSYLATNNILVIKPPPHATHHLQPCDLGIQGPFKSHMQTLRRNYCHDSQEFLIGLSVSALRQAITPVNILGGFLSGRLRETENVAGRMVAEYVPQSQTVADKIIVALKHCPGIIIKIASDFRVTTI